MADTPLIADYFDGQHAQAIPVALSVHGDMLQLTGTAVNNQIPLREIHWPERTRHGARIAQLPDGGALHARTPAEWDQWTRRHNIGEGWVVQVQQSWRLVGVAVVVLLALCAAGYLWGLPLASRGVMAVMPRSVDQQVGEIAMRSVEETWLHPSKLPKAEQERLRALFLQAQARWQSAQPPGTPTLPVKIHFRHARIGPNAFALPDGSLVFTDQLVKLFKGRDEVLVGVFAHELGHVQHRHSMRLLVQSGLLGAAASVAFGDFSQVLAATPALLGHMAYSRDFEREADDASIELLRANNIRPSVMAGLFDELAAYRRRPPPDEDGKKAKDKPQDPRETSSDTEDESDDEDDFGIAFSSHPADAERIARFKEADQR
ncbi:MAG: M48 family metallopeptidase [Aquabacterium sp.]|uniref:M48 family metallopeptidase n=1 Tax=Aquabacterium sp. TaxID=1872578 RepID=UPI003BAEA758